MRTVDGKVPFAVLNGAYFFTKKVVIRKGLRLKDQIRPDFKITLESQTLISNSLSCNSH